MATEGIQPLCWGESEIRGPVHLFRERLMERLLRSLLAAGRVLDAGCGGGSLALALARAGYQVEGIEQSPKFVRRVEEQARSMGLAERVRVRQGSVTCLDWQDGSFDGLVCGEVLEHLSPEQGGEVAAVREFYRVLRPGGACVVSVPLNPRLWDHCDEWAGHVKRYQRSELVALFAEGGFAVEKVQCWGFPLGRLYHRLFFAPWVRRIAGQELKTREARLATRIGRHPIAVESIALLLRLDELFGRWPWGRGIVLGARRRP